MHPPRLQESEIRPVLDRFYEKVRQDLLLGPVFAVVTDWSEHLQRLTEFWSSLMLTTGKYKGNPVAIHLLHAEKIEPEMFNRWLALWRDTTNDMLPAAVAVEMQIKAARIASRLNMALTGQVLELQSANVPEAPLTPYRTTKAFDETTVPRALLESHRVKSGSWAVVRVLKGAVHLVTEQRISRLDPARSGSIQPDVEHHLELDGPVLFQIDFFDRDPQGHSIERKHYA